MNQGRYEAKGNHPLMQAKLDELARMMKDRLPPHFGFSLLVFDTYDERFKDSGSMFYASTAGRHDNIKLMRELADALEKYEKEDKAKAAIPPFVCSCGHKLDSSRTPESDEKPSVGDISVCIRCAKMYIFNADHTVHEPTEAELETMKANKDGWNNLQDIRKMITQFRKERGLPL